MGLDKLSVCYALTCDICNLEYEGDGYVPHFPSEVEAREDSENSEWVWHDGEVWCHNCSPVCECEHHWAAHDMDGTDCEGDGEGCKQGCKKFKRVKEQADARSG